MTFAGGTGARVCKHRWTVYERCPRCNRTRNPEKKRRFAWKQIWIDLDIWNNGQGDDAATEDEKHGKIQRLVEAELKRLKR